MYPEFEELLVPVAVRLPLERLDLVVGTFHGPGGYGVVIPGKDASSVQGHGFAHLQRVSGILCKRQC